MQCLNTKNKEVAALLAEYTKILGNENAAYYVLSENNGYGLDKTPNGESSELFSAILSHFDGNMDQAIMARAKMAATGLKTALNDTLRGENGEITANQLLSVLESTESTFPTVDNTELDSTSTSNPHRTQHLTPAQYEEIYNTPVTDVDEPATGSDKTLVDRIFNGKSKVTVADALKNIKNSRPGLSAFTDILSRLLNSSLQGLTISYVPTGVAGSRVAASYLPRLNHIVVYGNARFYDKNGLADTAILHKIVHAATVSILRTNPAVRQSAEKLLESARLQLENKYGMSADTLALRHRQFYGLKNVEEFFAELFTNGSFVKELAQLDAYAKPRKMSFLKRVVNWLLQKFGASRETPSLYEQAAAELEHIMFDFVDPSLNGITDNEGYLDSFSDEDVFDSETVTNDVDNIKALIERNAQRIAVADDTHAYIDTNTGNIFTSISTIEERNGYGEDVQAMSDETLAYGELAAKAGSAIHDFVHSALTGETAPPSTTMLTDQAKLMIRGRVLPGVLGENSEIIASKQAISNEKANIAGTIDLLTRDEEGKIHLISFKTKARTFKGNKKYGFDYYFSSLHETSRGGKPDASRHDYQLSLQKKMLEKLGVQVDSKEIVPLEYNVDEQGNITDVWIPSLAYSEENGAIHHRVNNMLEAELDQTVFTADNNANRNSIETENLTRQSELVDDILRLLKNQLALYKVKGYATKAEVIKGYLDTLNSLEESEVIVSYVKWAVKSLKSLVTTYNELLEEEANGATQVWSLRRLEAWKNYAEAFSNLDDIQNYLFLNPKALSSLDKEQVNALRNVLATAITYKNILENAYKSKGETLWLNWLTPFTSRVEAEYRRDAERKFKKRNKGTALVNDKAAMNKYIEQYIANHRTEIGLKSRELVRQQSRLANTSPVNGFTQWVDTVFESSDTIVGAMTRAYHTTWMNSLDEFNSKYKTLVDLTEELEKAFPSLKNDPSKLYEFMVETDETGSRLISRLPLSFQTAYQAAKDEIDANPEYETARQKAIAIATWLNNNAPIEDEDTLRQKKLAELDDLFNKNSINKEQLDALKRNELLDRYSRQTWADMVDREIITEDIADYLRVKFNQLNWEHRQPNKTKYPNRKWVELEKLRQANPNDIRVRFFDFIDDLAKEGDTCVPERFKLNGRLPGMSKKFAERVVSGNAVSQLLAGVKNEFTLRPDDTDKGVQMTDELDRPVKFVPIYFTNTLSSDEQSLDIATIYKEWFRSVNNYKYINEILPQLQYTKWVVENRKTVKTDSRGNPIKNIISRVANNGTSEIDPSTNALITDDNLIKQVNEWFDQVIYDESSKNMGTVLGMDNAKLVGLLQKYTSLKIMGVNFVSMFNNALVAEVQQMTEAFARQYISSASYTKASAIYAQELFNIMGDIGARKPTSIINLLNEHFGVFLDYNEGSMLDNNKFKKLCKTSTMYFTTNVGEHEAQSRFLVASLLEKRALDKDGNDIGAMYDYFSVENGRLVFDKEHKVANFDAAQQRAFGQQITAILRKMHGNYASYSKVALQHYGFGKLALMFRKWIYTTYKRRVAKEYYDEYGQTFSKGFYRDGFMFYRRNVESFFRRFSDEAKALEIAEKADWETMTEDEKANVRRFTTEIATFIVCTILSELVHAYEPDDDDSFAALAMSHLDYQLFRLSTDISFYFDPRSFFKIVQSPLPSSNVVKSIGRFLDSCCDPFARFKNGDMKGELKIKKRALDLIPVTRQIYRLRNIEDEKQLLSIL